MSDSKVPPRKHGKLSPKDITEAANTAVYRAANKPVDFAGYYAIKPPKSKKAFDPEESAESVMGDADYEAQRHMHGNSGELSGAMDSARAVPRPPAKKRTEDMNSYSFKTFAARSEMGVAQSPEKLRREATSDIFDEVAQNPELSVPTSAAPEYDSPKDDIPYEEQPPRFDGIDGFVPLDDSSLPPAMPVSEPEMRMPEPQRQFYEDASPAAAPRMSPVAEISDDYRVSGREAARQRRVGAPERKKRKKISFLGAMIIAAVIVGLFAGALLFFESYSIIAGSIVKRDVTSLDLSGADVKDVTGIVRCQKLTSLDLSDCDISIRQYARLRKALPECDISWDIPLTDGVRARSTSTELDMSGITITDPEQLIKSLSLFPQLTTVKMDNCGLSDAELAHINRETAASILWTIKLGDTKLSSDAAQIDFSGNTSSSVSEMKQKLDCFTQLEYIDLTGCGYDDESLAKLNESVECDVVWEVCITSGDKQYAVKTNAASVTLADFCQKTRSTLPTEGRRDFEVADRVKDENKAYTPVDISALKYCYKLTDVSLIHCGIDDVSVFAGMKGLVTLSLHDNAIKDISPLADLSGLDMLNLGENLISDIQPLAKLSDLQQLDLSGNFIKDVSPLAGMKCVQVLSLKDNLISDVAPLGGLSTLTELSLSENDIEDFSALKQLTGLKYLSIAGNMSRKETAPVAEDLKHALPDCNIYSTYS